MRNYSLLTDTQSEHILRNVNSALGVLTWRFHYIQYCSVQWLFCAQNKALLRLHFYVTAQTRSGRPCFDSWDRHLVFFFPFIHWQNFWMEKKLYTIFEQNVLLHGGFKFPVTFTGSISTKSCWCQHLTSDLLLNTGWLM